MFCSQQVIHCRRPAPPASSSPHPPAPSPKSYSFYTSFSIITVRRYAFNKSRVHSFSLHVNSTVWPSFSSSFARLRKMCTWAGWPMSMRIFRKVYMLQMRVCWDVVGSQSRTVWRDGPGYPYLPWVWLQVSTDSQ